MSGRKNKWLAKRKMISCIEILGLSLSQISTREVVGMFNERFGERTRPNFLERRAFGLKEGKRAGRWIVH